MDKSNIIKRTTIVEQTAAREPEWKRLHMVMTGSRLFRIPSVCSKQFKYENTYRLDPIRKFNPARAETVLRQILEKHFQGRSYDPGIHPRLTTTMTDEIKSRMKALNYQRYRYVVHMTVGQKQNQGLQVVSRCVWDEDRDSFASVTFQSIKDIFAVATVYAVYFE